MHLYILKFSKRPDLVKIGVAKKSSIRIRVLEPVHGKCEILKVYELGNHAGKVERLLHSLLEELNTDVGGDGGTEFFKIEDFSLIEDLISLCGGYEIKEEVIKVHQRKRTRKIPVITEPKPASILDLTGIINAFYKYNMIWSARNYFNNVINEMKVNHD